MYKKFRLFILIIILSIILASVFGFLHNQISFTISDEYFTKFKFKQFGFEDYGMTSSRLYSGLIGIVSSWWVGLIIALFHGTIPFFLFSYKDMWKYAKGAILRNLGITFLFSILGILFGIYHVSYYPKNSYDIPLPLKSEERFFIAGMMHNFSYIGGVVGLLCGVYYQFKRQSFLSKK